MVMVGKLSLSPAVMAANRSELYAFVPRAMSRDQFLKDERDRKQRFRDRLKKKKAQAVAELFEGIELKMEIVE